MILLFVKYVITLRRYGRAAKKIRYPFSSMWKTRRRSILSFRGLCGRKWKLPNRPSEWLPLKRNRLRVFRHIALNTIFMWTASIALTLSKPKCSRKILSSLLLGQKFTVNFLPLSKSLTFYQKDIKFENENVLADRFSFAKMKLPDEDFSRLTITDSSLAFFSRFLATLWFIALPMIFSAFV